MWWMIKVKDYSLNDDSAWWKIKKLLPRETVIFLLRFFSQDLLLLFWNNCWYHEPKTIWFKLTTFQQF